MSLFRKILVPHDFSDDATAALKVAGKLARKHGGRLHIVHVNPPVYPTPAFQGDMSGVWIPPSSMVGQQRASLERIAARALGTDPPPYTCTVTKGNPTDRILDVAAKADSIVMGTAGRTGLAHLAIGSVAERVVRYATVPVLTIPSSETVRKRRARKKSAAVRKKAPPRSRKRKAA